MRLPIVTAQSGAMSEFRPITTVSDLAVQDDGEILAGYQSGLRGDPEPGSDRSRGFWHGWRNGMADSGRKPVDDAQRELAAAFCAITRRVLH